MGGVYDGVIADVTMLMMNNRFAGAKVTEPTIVFADGLLLVPNQKMRAALIAMHGKESDGWRGLTIRIRRVPIEYHDRKTGERKVRYEKRAENPDAVQPAQPAWDRGGDFADVETTNVVEFERADYDDRTDDKIAEDQNVTRRRKGA